MRTLSRFAPLALLAAFSAWMPLPPFTVATGSSVRISGTSNVHDWSCSTNRVTGSFTGDVSGQTISSISNLTFTVPVAALDCRNSTMNGNLRRAMNASSQPNVTFRMASATVTAGQGGRSTVSGTGQLTINGRTKPVRITATGVGAANGRTRFTGSVPVVMSEYGVTPPVAMMGTMRTGDRVTVAFDVLVGQ